MKLSCFLAFFLLWVVNSFRTSATVPDSLLTERTIRSIYVNYPDSALRLLDEAEKSPASGIIPFRIDLLRAMCYEIKHDLTAKEICVRRALQNDSIRLVPERKLSSIAMLANILERQNRYEESIGVCHEGIDLARNLACKKEESDMYSVMARVCIGMTNDEMAQEYFQRAVRLLEGTDDTDARDIVYVFYHIVYGGFLSVTLQLFDNALRSLDPRLDMFNRIILVYMLKFIVQDLHLRLHLTQCRTVYQRNLLPAIDSIPIFNLKLHIPSQSLLSQKALRPFCHISYFYRRFFVTKIPYS